MIKCSICSYQCEQWIISERRFWVSFFWSWGFNIDCWGVSILELITKSISNDRTWSSWLQSIWAFQASFFWSWCCYGWLHRRLLSCYRYQNAVIPRWGFQASIFWSRCYEWLHRKLLISVLINVNTDLALGAMTETTPRGEFFKAPRMCSKG